MKKEITRHNYPGSEKVYVPGKLHDIKVAMRKVNLTDTVNIVDGERIVRHNDPVYVYDTSGVYTDPAVEIDRDIHIETERVADGGHPVADRLDLLEAVDVMQLLGAVHLEGGVALLMGQQRLFPDIRRPVAADPAVDP